MKLLSERKSKILNYNPLKYVHISLSYTGVPVLTITLMLKRNFTPLVLNTFMPTFLLTFINQLTNYFGDHGTLEGITKS